MVQSSTGAGGRGNQQPASSGASAGTGRGRRTGAAVARAEQRSATASSPSASSSGIGRSRGHRRPTSQPCTVISSAAAATSRGSRGRGRRPTLRRLGRLQAASRAHAFGWRSSTRARRHRSVDRDRPAAASVKASRASSMCASRSAEVPALARRRPVQVGAVTSVSRPGCRRVSGRGARPDVGSSGRHDSGRGRRGRVVGGQPLGQPELREQVTSKNAPTCRTRSPSSSSTCSWNGTKSPAGCACRARRPAGRWPGREHRHVVDAAGALVGDQPADVLGADVPAEERRHLPRPRLEQGDDRVDVLAPERVDVAVQQLLLPGGEVSWTVSSVRPRSAIWACARWRAELTAAVVVSSASATSAADQRSTSRRISTARWRAGRCCSAATKASRIESRSATTTAASGTGSSQAISWFCSSASPAIWSGCRARRAAGARPALEVGQADVGGDPVEPGAHRGAALEVRGGLPGAQERLLDQVLGLVHRAAHPVAVRQQLALVALGQGRKSSSSVVLS